MCLCEIFVAFLDIHIRNMFNEYYHLRREFCVFVAEFRLGIMCIVLDQNTIRTKTTESEMEKEKASKTHC